MLPYFDCTFRTEWTTFRGKQTTVFVSSVLVLSLWWIVFIYLFVLATWKIHNWCHCQPLISPPPPRLPSCLSLSLSFTIDSFFFSFPPSRLCAALYLRPFPTLLPLCLQSPLCIFTDLTAGADLFSNCTEECKALGHSDRCWMPSFVPSDGRQGPDYRSNLHVPGMDATLPDTEVPSSVNLSDQVALTSSTASSSDRSFFTFGKDGQRSQSHNSLHHHLHPQQQQYSSGTLERKEYNRGTLPYKSTFFCEYQYEKSLGPFDFGLIQYRY